MKWAKTKSEINLIRKSLAKLGPNNLLQNFATNEKGRLDEEINTNYEVLENKLTNDSLHKMGFGKWLTVRKDRIPRGYENARARYEAFVGGYLYYFENHVKKPGTDHRVLYFDWGKINKDAGLTIFLNPLHVKAHPKPVYVDDVVSNNSNGKIRSKKNGQQLFKVLKNKTTKNTWEMAIAPPPLDGPLPAALNDMTELPLNGDLIDPPPPPHPPPPGRV